MAHRVAHSECGCPRTFLDNHVVLTGSKICNHMSGRCHLPHYGQVGFKPTERQIEISKLLIICISRSPGFPSPTPLLAVDLAAVAEFTDAPSKLAAEFMLRPDDASSSAQSNGGRRSTAAVFSQSRLA
jgi:hypothetical protein